MIRLDTNKIPIKSLIQSDKCKRMNPKNKFKSNTNKEKTNEFKKKNLLNNVRSVYEDVYARKQ